jgi:protein-disulfide isomerase
VENQIETSPAAPQPVAPPAAPSPVVTIRRDTFNTIIIALACFAMGIMVGAGAYDRLSGGNQQATQDLIDAAVNAALTRQEAQMQQIVAQALTENLGIRPAADQQPALDPNTRYTVEIGENPTLGPANAPVTIIEFSDFRCPYCGRFARETFGRIASEYEGQVRMVFRDYPILGPESLSAALAAECADDQGKFWDFHDGLFNNQQALGRDLYLRLAADYELDVDSFTTCIDTQQHLEEINTDFTAGQNLGVTGTPTFFINGRPISGAQPFESFAQAIEAELAVAQASDAPVVVTSEPGVSEPVDSAE